MCGMLLRWSSDRFFVLVRCMVHRLRQPHKSPKSWKKRCCQVRPHRLSTSFLICRSETNGSNYKSHNMSQSSTIHSCQKASFADCSHANRRLQLYKNESRNWRWGSQSASHGVFSTKGHKISWECLKIRKAHVPSSGWWRSSFMIE